MNDTSPQMEALYRGRLAALKGEDRFLRGARMFEVAREMVLASLPSAMSESEVKCALLRRFYGSDLPPEELEAVEQALRSRGSAPES